jgi:hypothetical protein
VSDTAAALAGAIGALDPALGIGSVTSLTVTGTATVAQADAIHGFNAKSALATYAVSDTVAHVHAAVADPALAPAIATSLTLADSATNLIAAITAADPALAIATAMAISGTPNLLQVDAILGYLIVNHPAVTATYSLADTTANLLSEPNLISIVGATHVTVTDPTPTLLVQDVDSLFILNANTTFTNGYNLADTAFDLLHPINPTTVTGASLVTVTDTVAPLLSVADAATLVVTDHAVFPLGYELFDTGAALVAASAATVHGALIVTVSDTMLVAQAATVHAELGVGATMVYSLTDTAVDLAAPTASSLVTAATFVTVTDTATVAQATTIHGESPTAIYSVTDTSAHLATALSTGNASLAAIEHSTTIASTDIVVANDGIAANNLTVNANEFVNLLAGPALLVANDTITIDGATLNGDANVNLGTLHAFGGNTAAVHAMNLGGANNGSYTVNMGTSGESSVTMDGTGVQHITASSATTEKFSVGALNHGGSFISNLSIGDSIDVIGARTPDLATAPVASAGLVGPPPPGLHTGSWNFSGGVLTWWDLQTSSVEHLTLALAPGAHGLTLDANHHSFTVI